MGGFFGVVSKQKCITDLFYGTDYQFHLGTRRGGIVTINESGHFEREIHNLENSYFRPRFEGELNKFDGKAGIGVISDTDAQPMLTNSHLGRFALVTVAKINNLEQLAQELIDEGDDTNGIDSILTIDHDGTERWYDLNGRELPGKPQRGIYIHNGQKHAK